MAKRDLGDIAVTALTRPGIGSALLAGLGVYLVLVLQSVLGTVAFVVTQQSYGRDPGSYLEVILGGTLPFTLGGPVPFAIGVFLSFWQIAPIAPQLRMAHVVTRALLAAVIGAVVAGLIWFLGGVALDVIDRTGAVDLAGLPAELSIALQFTVLPNVLNILIQGLVVVPLAALLLWGWQLSHPPKTAPAGALDDV